MIGERTWPGGAGSPAWEANGNQDASGRCDSPPRNDSLRDGPGRENHGGARQWFTANEIGVFTDEAIDPSGMVTHSVAVVSLAEVAADGSEVLGVVLSRPIYDQGPTATLADPALADATARLPRLEFNTCDNRAVGGEVRELRLGRHSLVIRFESGSAVRRGEPLGRLGFERLRELRVEFRIDAATWQRLGNQLQRIAADGWPLSAPPC